MKRLALGVVAVSLAGCLQAAGPEADPASEPNGVAGTSFSWSTDASLGRAALRVTFVEPRLAPACNADIGIAGGEQKSGIGGLAMILVDGQPVAYAGVRFGEASARALGIDVTGPAYGVVRSGLQPAGIENDAYTVRINRTSERFRAMLEHRMPNESISLDVYGLAVRPWPAIAPPEGPLGNDSIRLRVECSKPVPIAVYASRDVVLATQDDFANGTQLWTHEASYAADAAIRHEFVAGDVQIFAISRARQANSDGTFTVRAPDGVHVWNLGTEDYFWRESRSGFHEFELDRLRVDPTGIDTFRMVGVSWASVSNPGDVLR